MDDVRKWATRESHQGRETNIRRTGLDDGYLVVTRTLASNAASSHVSCMDGVDRWSLSLHFLIIRVIVFNSRVPTSDSM